MNILRSAPRGCVSYLKEEAIERSCMNQVVIDSSAKIWWHQSHGARPLPSTP